MIVQSPDIVSLHTWQVVLDFGLCASTQIPEDKGVDLYVLERAFKSAHSADGDSLVRRCASLCTCEVSLQALGKLYDRQGQRCTVALKAWSVVQFEVVLAAYKRKSRLWNPTLNKFAEGVPAITCVYVSFQMYDTAWSHAA